MSSEYDYIADDLQEHATPVDELHCDPSNVREHPEKNRQAVCESLHEFGQRQVLVADEDGRVIAGNLRLQVARNDLGWSHVACIQVDDDELEAARYAIADNRTSELAEWDEEGRNRLLESLDAEMELPPGFDDVPNVDDALPDPEPVDFDEEFRVVVECEDEAEQDQVLDLLEAEGYTCRALIL